jgi:hypothetical protein
MTTLRREAVSEKILTEIKTRKLRDSSSACGHSPVTVCLKPGSALASRWFSNRTIFHVNRRSWNG